MAYNMTMKKLDDLRKPIGEFSIPKRIIHCRPEVIAQDVVEAMAEKNAGAAIITNEERDVLGIVTERDFLNKALAQKLDLSNTPISALMTGNPTTIKASTPLMEMVKIMLLGKFRRMIVTDDNNKLQFVVSLGDIVEIFFRTIEKKGL